MPAAASTTAPVSDPLAELEKALAEYEARQNELAEEVNKAVKKAETTTQQLEQPDPLAELERVLDEYEARQPSAADPQPVLDAAPATVSPVTPAASVSSAPTPAPSLSTSPSASTPASTAPAAEPIEEQNIFELLGVSAADDAEKEAFLDELQQALWDDFLEKDVELLVNPQQLQQIRDIQNRTELADTQRQEQLVQKVEEIVPDIEEIMLEKALQLKEDMVKERLSGMKDYFKDRPTDLATIAEAESLIKTGKWQSAARLLNTLTG